MSDDHDELAKQFEEHRERLRAIATRMLGSAAAGDDAVQTAWLRLTKPGAGEPDNLGGWLTTVVSRVAIDMLRARRLRDHDVLDDHTADPATGADPGEQAETADAVSAALLVVLDSLSAAERLAFVLRESFELPFIEIAAILGRSTTATKQLAHRARAKVRGHNDLAGGGVVADGEQRKVVDAFLSASRSGDLAGLITLLDPTIELVADARAVAMGSPESVRGAEPVGQVFSGRALGAQPAVVDGAVGIAWAVDGQVRVVWDLAIDADGTITHINMLADPDTLDRVELALL